MKALEEISGYRYSNAELNHSHDYLLPKVEQILSDLKWIGPRRIFELGCGNGAVANHLSARGYEVTGIDASAEGIKIAQSKYPRISLQQASAYDPLADRFGQFPVVLSLEVVEHLYAPRDFAKNVYRLLQPGGVAIISTPFHGYWKNLAMAVTGKMDAHFTALWDHGHIKFWSFDTLGVLLEEAGFPSTEFTRVGRIPMLAKSMIAIAKKPENP